MQKFFNKYMRWGSRYDSQGELSENERKELRNQLQKDENERKKAERELREQQERDAKERNEELKRQAQEAERARDRLMAEAAIALLKRSEEERQRSEEKCRNLEKQLNKNT